MELNEMNFPDGRPVDGYGPGFFRVGGQVFQDNVLLLPAEVVSWGGFDDVETLKTMAAELDVIFVGTGAKIAQIPSSFRQELETAGLGVEIMATPTACRTYNVLLSEGRRIAAALIAV